VRSACLGTRRYETFKDLAAWQQFVTDSDATLDRPAVWEASDVLAHGESQDWTIDEMQRRAAQAQERITWECAWISG